MVSTPRSFVVCLLLIGLLPVAVARAATLPAGFSESLVESGLDSPTAMQIAPDGRIFVCEQTGDLRVIKNGVLLPTPFVSLAVDANGERGLLGIAFDPNFATNQFVYVYYTTSSAPTHNRISRFTANGDVAVDGSELVVMDLEALSAWNHNGGAIDFGADGKLYIAVGDNGVSDNSQSLNTRLGKMLRINPDGSIPDDNPFGEATGMNRAIWALGLRNPFTFAFNSSGSRMFINDVGQETWEEINDGLAGANYGWPFEEGSPPNPNPNFRLPLYAYDHGNGGDEEPDGCAITGGAFYTPSSSQFPAEYAGDYFFADYCGGWIRKYDPETDSSTGFATGIGAPVDLKVVSDGSLYYLARGSGAVYRINYSAAPTPPTITSHPSNQTISVGGSATFNVAASGTPPLQYQWQRGTTDIPGATSASYTITGATLPDNGATFRARVTNGAGNALSNSATLTVSAIPNNPPTATITQPTAGTLYSGGSVIAYAGTGTDPQDGTLPASAFTWRVDFHHDAHTHPFIPSTTGAKSGSFPIPATGETSANVWYRIYLTVQDAGGLTHTVQRDITPRKVRLTLNTSPAGLQVRLDGQPTATPFSFDAVVGVVRSLAAISPQVANNTTYEFASWSDGGAATHDVSTPTVNTTYTVTYRPTTNPNSPPTATITQPTVGVLYSGGTVISYAGTGTDPQDGTLPASAFTWRVDFHHDAHAHTFIPPTTGAKTGSFTIPATGETAANVWYRVYLTVQDAGGLTHTVQRDILPRKVRVTLNTSPAGLQVRLDGQPTTTPVSFDAVVGIVRNLGAQSPQVVNNTNYEFVSWSDGGAAAHDISTPAVDTTYTATYRAVVSGPGSPPPPVLSALANGLSLSVWWPAVPGALSYRLEAGSAPNAADLFNGDVGRITSLQHIVPPGIYFLRVRSVGPGGTSAPSNEMRVEPTGAGPCVTPPPAPTGYNVQTSDLNAMLSWNASPSATSYVLEAGASSAAADLLTADVGNVRSLNVTGPAGLYFTRVRAINACGASAPSSEVPVALACSGAPPSPTLTITNAGGTLTLSWTASAGASVYRAQVGTASGLSNVFNGELGNLTGLTADARGITGTYFVRVFAVSGCGTSPASNEVVVRLP